MNIQRAFGDVEDFKNADLAFLMEQASSVRDAEWKQNITYSRKVFIPLTNMCRDTCGYCTFVKHPTSKEAVLMTPEQVLKVARDGENEGCKEILFSLGEKPEVRYKIARQALAKIGYSRLTDYLKDMCSLVLEQTSLLPHVNAGTLDDDEVKKLKPVVASMGMMLETLSRRLTRNGRAHFACPDKMPIQRLRTMERMGKYNVPFTTGLLIGIGETWDERVEALQAINRSHKRFGHVQEVIIQNFTTKPDIPMSGHPEPTLAEMLRTIAVARLILDPEISLQAPPNLSERHVDYISAGINDWGGISPITKDFINPEKDWPEIRSLSKSTRSKGFNLKERLTVYPKFQKDGRKFLSTKVLKRVEELSGKDGLAKKQAHIEIEL